MPNKRINADGENAGGADAAIPVARWLCETLSRSLRFLNNAADEEYPLFALRFAPHNQRIEQMPFGHSSSSALSVNETNQHVQNIKEVREC